MQWMNSLNLPRSQDGITNAMMALEKVLSILRKERGRQFDPDVTDAFLLNLDRDKDYNMREKDIEDINVNKKGMTNKYESLPCSTRQSLVLQINGFSWRARK